MTNKEQIINDGVDVSKCKWHTNLKMDCLELPTQPFKCANDTNCYFKQLKRKEQECEKLKEELKMNQKFVYDSSVESTEFCKKLEQYKQALDEIEKILDNGTKDTQTNNAKWLQQHYLARFCEIRDIINKAKGEE